MGFPFGFGVLGLCCFACVCIFGLVCLRVLVLLLCFPGLLFDCLVWDTFGDLGDW